MESFSGLSSHELIKRGVSIAYDDFRILDTEYTSIEEDEIDLSIDLGQGVVLKTPIIASPMDTVTNSKLCIAIANMGGIGCIHMNYKKVDNTPDIDAQISEIIKVKRYENGFIEHPVTINPEMTIAEAIKAGTDNDFGIKIKTFPVVNQNGLFLGMLRAQDYSTSMNTNLKVQDRMLFPKDLIVAKHGISLEDANKILWDSHLLVLPIIDEEGYLKALVSRTDIEKNEKFPHATKDSQGRLRVLFAIETRTQYAYERLKRGFEAGADGVIIDTSQGYTKYEKDMVDYIKKTYPDKLLIGGNISTKEAMKGLYEWGVDGVRIGQGSGSICTTALAIGISRASATSVYECAHALSNKIVKRPSIIADGGLKNVGDIIKALILGADAVMLGNMLAGTDEAPGEPKYLPATGEYVKEYRGMGSKEANTTGIRGYTKLPQGVSGYVPYKGPLGKLIKLYRDGIITGMKVLNCKNVQELKSKAEEGILRFEKNTSNAGKEMGANVREK